MNPSATLHRTAILATLLLAATAFAGQAAAAQTAQPDPRWHAWLGCWEPIAADEFEAAPPVESAIVCVLPVSSGSEVEAVSVVDGGVVERDILEATGARRAVERDGCTGWESMEWSQDARRVFQRTEFECAGGLQHHSTGLFAILPGGEWLTVHATSAGDNTDVHVLRYRSIRPDVVDAELAAALAGRGLAVDAARMAAASRLTIDHVAEATRQVDAAVVEAWLIEQGQGFGIDAARLVAMADAGIPDRVIDLMVALSYPNVFAVNRSAREGGFRPDEGRAAPPLWRPGRIGGLNPWLYPGYGGYGWGGYRGYPGAFYPPVVVVRDGGSRNQGGRMVSGRGYSQGNRGSSGTSNPPSTSSGGSRPSPSASPAPRSGGSGSSSGSGRTAQPRSDS